MRAPIVLYQPPKRQPTDYRIGLSAWTDKSMLEEGQFYPRKTMTAEERLWWYSRFSDAVEVNSSFYAIPSAETAALWAGRTPAAFLFKREGLRAAHRTYVQGRCGRRYRKRLGGLSPGSTRVPAGPIPFFVLTTYNPIEIKGTVRRPSSTRQSVLKLRVRYPTMPADIIGGNIIVEEGMANSALRKLCLPLIRPTDSRRAPQVFVMQTIDPGTSTTLPWLGRCTVRGSGASFVRDKCVRLRL